MVDINPAMSVITLNVSVLHVLIKKQGLSGWINNWDLTMSSTGNLL